MIVIINCNDILHVFVKRKIHIVFRPCRKQEKVSGPQLNIFLKPKQNLRAAS
jgi:hypothetical protein